MGRDDSTRTRAASTSADWRGTGVLCRVELSEAAKKRASLRARQMMGEAIDSTEGSVEPQEQPEPKTEG